MEQAGRVYINVVESVRPVFGKLDRPASEAQYALNADKVTDIDYLPALNHLRCKVIELSSVNGQTPASGFELCISVLDNGKLHPKCWLYSGLGQFLFPAHVPPSVGVVNASCCFDALLNQHPSNLANATIYFT
ncbi:DNA polymerase III alpha subunit [Aeromonas phage Gekk3-15]